MIHIDRANPKGDRVLELHEQGLDAGIIAERVGVSRGNVANLLLDAKRRRARKAALQGKIDA